MQKDVSTLLSVYQIYWFTLWLGDAVVLWDVVWYFVLMIIRL